MVDVFLLSARHVVWRGGVVSAGGSLGCGRVGFGARVAQWIRRCPPKAEIAGSSPAVSRNKSEGAMRAGALGLLTFGGFCGVVQLASWLAGSSRVCCLFWYGCALCVPSCCACVA